MRVRLRFGRGTRQNIREFMNAVLDRPGKLRVRAGLSVGVGALLSITVADCASELADRLFSTSSCARIQIELAPENLNRLRQESRRDVPATIRVLGRVYPEVAVHLKGSFGSYQSVERKPSFTFEFSRSDGSGLSDGFQKLHLNNSVEDHSYLREQIGSELFAAAGLRVPRVAHAVVELNGRRLGLYILKEGFTKEFFAQHFGKAVGPLYEPIGGQDVGSRMESHLSTDTAHQEQTSLQRLASAAIEPDLTERWRLLGEVLDFDRFITFMAMEIMIGHWDGYCLRRNNFRIYHDLAIDKLIFLPAGMDQIFEKPDFDWQPDMDGLVARAVMEVPVGHREYAARFKRLFNSVFRTEQITNRVNQLLAPLRPVLSSYEFEETAREAAVLCAQIDARARSLQSQLNDAGPDVPVFAGGVAKLDRWNAVDLPTGGEMLVRAGASGESLLRITAATNTSASWRARVRLPRGCYQFQGQVKVESVRPLEFGKQQGAGLRVEGRAGRSSARIGAQGWQSLGVEFEVRAPEEQIVLICELRARMGQADFKRDSLVLVRRACRTDG